MNTCEKGSEKAGRLVVYFGEDSWQALWRWVGVWGGKAVDCANLAVKTRSWKTHWNGKKCVQWHFMYFKYFIDFAIWVILQSCELQSFHYI